MKEMDKNISTLIIVGGNIEDYLKALEHVEQVTVVRCKYCMPYENNLPIYIGKDQKIPLKSIWKAEKIFI